MSAENFATGLITLMGGLPELGQAPDGDFIAAFTALLGSPPTVVLTNRPAAEINAEQLPAIVIAQADGEARSISEGGDAFLVIGGTEQSFESSVSLDIVWREQDHDAAFIQITRLPELFAQFLLRNPQPGGIAGAWLQAWGNDRGTHHPTQRWGCELRGQYVIDR